MLFAKFVKFVFVIAGTTFPKDFHTTKDLNNWGIGSPNLGLGRHLGSILSVYGVALGLGRFGGPGSEVGLLSKFQMETAW